MTPQKPKESTKGQPEEACKAALVCVNMTYMIMMIQMIDGFLVFQIEMMSQPSSVCGGLTGLELVRSQMIMMLL